MEEKRTAKTALIMASRVLIMLVMLISILSSDNAIAISLDVNTSVDSYNNFYELHISDVQGSLEEYELWVSYTDTRGIVQESKYFGTLQETINFVPVGDGKYTFRLHNIKTHEVVSSENLMVGSPSDVPVDIPADVPEDVSVDIPAAIPVDAPADPIVVPADVPEDTPVDVSAENSQAETQQSDNPSCNAFSISDDIIRLGDSVDILMEPVCLGSNDYQMYITHVTDYEIQTFLLRTEPNELPSFTPSDSGEYNITLVCSDASSHSEILYVEGYSEGYLEEISDGISESRMIHVMDSDGKIMLGTIELKDVKKEDIRKVSRIAQPVSQAARNLGLDGVGDTIDKVITSKSEVDVASEASIQLDGIEGFDRSDMKLRGLVVDDYTLLKIEHVHEDTIAVNGENVVASYAMDLSTLEFNNGTFTKVASGGKLWKCREWDYDTQACLGEWVKIMDITPGMPYSLEISPVDPGYAETGLVTINTNKSMYHPGESVEILVAVLNRQGYLVSGANLSLMVISPDNSTYIYTTDNANDNIDETIDDGLGTQVQIYPIVEVSKGIYSCIFMDNAQEGDYYVEVDVTGDGILMDDNHMSTSFAVRNYYEFDILRTAPMSFDPFNGAFDVGLEVTSYLTDYMRTTFALEERIPKDFIILNAGGGIVSSDSTSNIITWSDLGSGSRVSYKVKAPLIVPELWLIGPARVIYDTYDGLKVFEEYRSWMLAADPVGSSKPTAYTDTNNIGTNEVNAYDSSTSTYATLDIDAATAARYVVYTTFNTSGYDTSSTLNALNITYDVATTGTFSNDQWSIQYSTNGGTSWTTCSSGGTSISRQNITCTVSGISGWTISTFASNFQIRLGGNRAGGADGVSMLVYDTYATLDYTPPNIVPSPLSYAKNATTVYQNDTIIFNATWIDYDNALSHWIFSWNTSTGWVNDTAVAFTSNNLSNASKTINFAEGTVISWRFYANDSSGEWNSTPIQNFTVYAEDNTPPVIHWINVAPVAGLSGTRFNLTANVTDNQIVGVVRAELMYPNGTRTNYTMSNLGSGIYSYIYNSSFGGNFSFIVYASDGSNYNVSTSRASFNVTSNISTDWKYYARGEGVIISGIGFSPWRTVELNVTDPDGNIVSGFPRNILTNATGGFRYQWNISSSTSTPLGNYTISIKDNTITWINSSTDVTVVIKPTSATMVTDDPSAPGGSAGTLTMNVFSNINNSDNVYANIVSSTVEVYLEAGFSNVMSVGQDVTSAVLYFEHREISTADVYVKWYNSSSGTYTTVCTITDSATETFSNCDLSGVIFTSDDVNSLSIRLADNNGGANNANWTLIDFVYLLVNFTASSDMSIYINEPPDTLVTYDYYSSYSKAYGGSTTEEPPDALTTGTEATSTQYAYLRTSDNNRFSTQVTGSGGLHAYQSFKFVVIDPIAEITELKFTHEGYATRTTSLNPDPFIIYLWNITSGSYDTITNVDGTSADVITVSSIIGNGSDYINATTGEIWFLVEGTFATGGGPNAQADLHTDLAKLDISKVPVLSGMENINATVVDADGVGSCNYFYTYTNGSIANISYPLSSYPNNIYFNISDTAIYPDGFYYLYVNCSDSSGTLTNASKYVKILNSAPYIILLAPPNSSNLTYNNINFTWYLYSSSQGIGQCNLTIDNSIVESGILTTVGYNTTWNETVTDGVHYWNITCMDPSSLSNSSDTWNIDVDTTPPNITLNYPPINHWLSNRSIIFNYTPVDAHSLTNCSIYIDGIYNQSNTSVNRSNPNYFTISNFTEGLHNWTINCTDSFGLNSQAITRNFTVDIGTPNITLYYPDNDANFTGGNMTINFSVRDNLDTVLSCNLTIDDFISETYRDYPVNNDTLTSITEFNIADGVHYWNLTCWDDAYNINYTETRNFSMVGPPRIVLNSPANGTWFNYQDIEFNYYVFDGDGIANCSIYLDGVYNQTNSTGIINDGNNTFNITSVSQGLHSWYLRCFDSLGGRSQSTTRYFNVDITRPSIELYYPINSESFTNTTIEFNYSVTDNMDELLVCNLTIDGSVSVINNNINSSNNSLVNLTEYNVTDGVHYWNITCWDDAYNYNTSLTRNFSIDTVPNVILIDPANNAKKKNNITFTYNASDMSGLASCSFIFDGSVNQTVYIPDISNGINTFNLTLIPEGLYTWTVNCTDLYGLSSQPPANNLTVDITAPSIYANTPNGTTISNSTVMFNFTAIDALTPVMNCTIFVDGDLWVNDTIAQNNTPVYFNITDITDGVHYWNVSCEDEAYNLGYSNTLNFTVDSSPLVTLYQPYNNTGDADGNVLFTYYLSEGNLTNCSLLINGAVNQTRNASEIVYKENDGLNNFTVNGMSEGNYTWNVRCSDTSGANGTGSTRTLYIDFNTPYNITLYEPANNSTKYTSTIMFNWTVYDAISPQLYCNLSINGVVNQTNITAYNGTVANSSISGFTAGDYNWSVTCYDLAGWSIQSITNNFTISALVMVTPIYPPADHFDGDGNITFQYIPESINDFNTVGTCELYLDGVSNETAVRPINGGINTITLNNIAQGSHTWYLNCSDNAGLSGVSETRSFLVDLIDPYVTLNYPLTDTIGFSYVNFNFTAIDNIATSLMCNITVNGSIVASNINATNGSYTNYTVYGLVDGLHYWNVTCADFGGRTNTSLTSNFTIAAPPIVRLLWPPEGYRNNTVNMTLYYNATDNSNNISNCTLILNGQPNQTKYDINLSLINNFTANGLVDGTYTWDVNCTDQNGNIGNNGTATTFYIDLMPPYINLSYPEYAQTFNTNNITFNWTPIDFNNSILVNCTLFVEDPLGMGDRTVNNITGYSNTTFSYLLSNFSDGTHYWNVTCSDDLNNINTSVTWNFIINQPDLYINDSRIILNNTNPNLNESINITANVSNYGGITASNVLVEFWDGDPSSGVFIGNTTGSVAYNGSSLFSMPWNITEGYHIIHVLVDPYNLIAELNETNNNATYNISVLRSIINSPLNQSIFTVQNVSFNFTLIDYTSDYFAGLINYSVFVDNVFNGQSGVVSDNMSNLINITFTQGLHSVQIEALDYLGRRKNSTAVFVIIDYTPPNATILTANNTWYNFSTPNITIRATDNLDTNINYTIYANNTFNTAGNLSNNTNMQINLTALTDGYYQLIMEAYDDFNNTANSSPVYIYVDMTPPNITLNSPVNGANYTSSEVLLNYTPRDNLASLIACNITLDGNIVSSQDVGNGNSTTYNATNLVEGVHYWNVTCRDQALNTNVSETFSFNIFVPPEVTLVSPMDNNWSRYENNTFYFNVSDDSGLMNCSLIIDGTIADTLDNSQVVNNATNNFTVIGMNSGNYTWAVECYDNTTYNYYTITPNRTFYVDLFAPQPYILTANQSWFNAGNPLININITDNMDQSLDYIIYVNDGPNVTGAVSNDTNVGINLIGLQNGTYTVILEGIDNAGNRQNSTPITIFIDSVRPSINLTNPLNDTNITVTVADLNFTASDNIASVLNCSVMLDNAVIVNGMAIFVDQLYNITVSELQGGYHYWNVTCTDLASNVNTSVTNRFYVVMPDLYINSSSIYLSNDIPVENESLNITAEIYNIGLAIAQNFTVQVTVSNLSGSYVVYEGNMTLDVNESTNVTANYIMGMGNTTFYVLVDVPLLTNGTIRESNESNNNASRSVYVALWQFIVGNTSDRLTMTDITNQTIYDWLVSNASGSKIFAADIDSNINWRSLKALGMNASNQSSLIDFATLDASLGSTDYTDSVNRTYTFSGAPLETINYTIFARQVNDVPIVNSTNNTNFKTGILWDYSDGGARYLGTQDVLFVSPINKGTVGYNATVDYEIRVPASLRSYLAGQDAVVFYAEIN